MSLKRRLGSALAKFAGFRLFGLIEPLLAVNEDAVAQSAALTTAYAGRTAPVAVACASLDGLLLSRP